MRGGAPATQHHSTCGSAAPPRSPHLDKQPLQRAHLVHGPCPARSGSAARGAAGEDVAGSKEDEGQELWQPDWDDEDSAQDFAAKLRQELDRNMKD